MTATIDEAARRRAARRRRLQQRQTVIFGGLVTVLLVIGLLAGAVWTGLLPAPISREFTAEESPGSSVVTPCPPEGAIPVPLNTVTANVYNGTERAGLAAQTASALGGYGVVINQQANWPTGYDGVAQIVTGPLGVTAAYSVARLFEGAVISLDSGRGDESIDVVLGEAFQTMMAPEQVAALDPNAPFAGAEGCTPVDSAEAPAG